jgi:hypothetical protein
MASVLGCTTIAPVSSPGTYIASKQPRTVWLYRGDHSVARVNGPRMVGDTVVGSVNGQYAEIPLKDVTRVTAMQTSMGKTVALAAVGGAATIAVLVVVLSKGGSGSGSVNQMIMDTMTLELVH